MDYFVFIPLFLTLAAALLAIRSAPFEAGKLTRTGWIAAVAILAFLVGAYNVYVKEMEKKDLHALACFEIERYVTAISKSEEKQQLLKLRGASKDPKLLSKLHEKVSSAKSSLDIVASRHISSLGVEERRSLIRLLNNYAILDNILSNGYNDFTGSAARIALYRSDENGDFKLCTR